MTTGSTNQNVKKFTTILKIAFMVTILFLFVRNVLKSYRQGKNQTKESCEIEVRLEFEGIISEYNGRGYKTIPIIFMIKDSTFIIPRYNSEMNLYVGDTIKKVKGSHTYLLRRCILSANINSKRLDTINFICP